jgi:4'-phosphopantetheinyl transferase EntD
MTTVSSHAFTHSNGCAISALAPRSTGSLLGVDLEHGLEDELAEQMSATIINFSEATVLGGAMRYGVMLAIAFSAADRVERIGQDIRDPRREEPV